jgi:hypothetical protein
VKSFRLSRRALLRGAGGVAISLPLLEAMEARAATAPKRFIVFASPEGCYKLPYSAWIPSNTSSGLALSPILAPLERHKDKLLVIGGLDVEAAYRTPLGELGGLAIEGHQSGPPTVLTGAPFIYDGITDQSNLEGGGISIDQQIADSLAGQTRFRSLELGVQSKGVFGNNPRTAWSYRAAQQSVPIEDDPVAAFDRIFQGLASEPADAIRRRARRRLVLDEVMGDINRLTPKLGTTDRQRLDAHLTAVRELEQRVTTPPTSASTCPVPGRPMPDNYLNPALFREAGKLQMDLLAMALGCDLTRVASLIWSHSASYTVFSWLGQGAIHHDVSHNSPTDPASHIAIQSWYEEQFAYFLDLLTAPQADGTTLLDNTVIFRAREMAWRHGQRGGMPFLLAGSCGGYFRTGRFVDFGVRPHNDLLISFTHAMGVPQSTFGMPELCSGPLAELT